MQKSITDGQWAAARACIEGAPSTHARIAAVMGVHVTTVSHRSAEYGWTSLDYRHPRVRQAQRGLVALAAAARAGEPLDPAHLAEGLDEAGQDAVADAAGGLAALHDEAFTPEPLPDLPLRERAQRLRTMLIKRSEELMQRAAAGLPLENRQILALSSLLQLAERMTALPEDMAAAEEEYNEEIGSVLERLNAKIVELAHGLAQDILIGRGLSPREARDAVENWNR